MRMWLWSLVFLVGGVHAQQALVEGTHYETVSPAASDRTIVVEYFSYGCPGCFRTDPYVEAWKEQKPEGVEFRRVHVGMGNRMWEILAQAFYVAQALGVGEELHQPIFDWVHVEKNTPRKLSDLAEVFATAGVSEEQLEKTAQSFAVVTQLKRAETEARRFRLSGVPSFVVNDRYRLSTGGFKSYDELFAGLTSLATNPPE